MSRICTGDLHALAFTLNEGHGRPLTLADRKAEATRLLRNGVDASNNDLARRCGLSDKTVAKVRTDLESTSDIPKLDSRTGADGKNRSITRNKKSPHDDTTGKQERSSKPVDPEIKDLFKLTGELIDYLEERDWTDDRAADDLTEALVLALKEHRDASDLQRVVSLLKITIDAYQRAAGRIGSAEPDVVEEVAA